MASMLCIARINSNLDYNYAMNYWYILLIIFLAIFFLIELPLILAAFSMAPWVPSRKSDLERINRLAALKEGETFYDLGCGDGRVCTHIAKNNRSVKVVGLELAYPLFLWAKLNQFRSGAANMEIRMKNVFKYDLSDADVVYYFGIPPTLNNQLKKKFERELRKGARVITYDIPMVGWEIWEKDHPADAKIPIFVYRR